MRPHVRAFFEICARVLDCPEPIVEIGSYRVPGQEAIADLRPVFRGKHYTGCDMRPGPGVDRIEDLHALSFRDVDVGTFLLADTLEHVADPLRAMSELHRALRRDGLVLFTSVMHFPIHAYPNDYWRFTPEAFRKLAARFACAAVYRSGDARFPHTVAAVACGPDYAAERLEDLAEPVRAIDVPAPLSVEGRAGRLIRHLAGKLVAHCPETAARAELHGALADPFTRRGWVAVTGQWVQGWVAADGVRDAEIWAGDRRVHQTRLTLPRPDVAAQLGLDPELPIGFRDLLRLDGLGDIIGPLRLVGVSGDGARRTAAVTPPGLLIGKLSPEAGFMLHSFDRRAEADPRAAARRLIEDLCTRGERVSVDLGCGFRKRGTIGIDAHRDGTSADLICRLGFEPIPLDDACADEVIAKNFLEHLPKAVYSEHQGTMVYPIIELFNEVWRILKPGAVFTSITPCYPNPEVHQDPTHLSVWTPESMAYFCGKYPVSRFYGVRTSFELVESRVEGFYLHARLRKPQAAAA